MIATATQLPLLSALKNAKAITRALAHEIRLEILNYIKEKESTTVSPIYRSFGLEQSIISAHLKILRKAGIVKTQRDGKYIYYSINQENFKKYSKAIDLLNG